MKNINGEIKYKKKDLKKELLKSYSEALKNEAFSSLVSKIKLKEEVLIKYTSLLEESSIEYSNCQNCKGIFECKNKICGHAYLPRVFNGNLEFNYKACKYQIKMDKNNAYLKNVYMLDEPLEIKNAKMKDIYLNDKKRVHVIKYLKKFLEDYPNSKGIYLSGNFGCGKTYLIAALFNELAKKNIKSAIIFWPEFLRSLKANFSDDYNDRFEYIKKVNLLLIDDIGAENMTVWSRDEVLAPILQYRMQQKLPTFFTSNLSISELEKHLSTSREKTDEVKARRIIERIKELTTSMEMVSENLRK